MSHCPEEDQLALLLKNELSEELASRVANHIDTCERCQTTLDRITSEDAIEPDPDLSSSSSSSSARSEILEDLVSRLVSSSVQKEFKPSLQSSWSIIFPGPPSADAPLGTLGDYAVIERIADGGHGAVYRAIDRRLNREVAIKVLRHCSDESRVRFQREARAAAALKNEHIVTLYESGNYVDFPPYLVMEHVRGESLSAKLQRAGTLDPKEAAGIVMDVARGVACAHRQGLIHRDIKPSNVLMDEVSGKAKITDFGLVRDESSDSLLTVEGAIAGTPAYMSPEQITTPSMVDGRSDIYSLGVMLYELLTGVVPFRGILRMTLLQVVHDDPRPPRYYNDNVPRDLETICLKAMSKEPERRYSDCQALADDLRRWLAGESILARPVTRLEKSFQWCRRNPLMAGLTLCVVVLLILLTSGSLIVAGKLSRDAAAERLNASKAQEQRDAMIDTLGRLIFQLQEDFENDDVDYDAVQRSALGIALDGLQSINLRESLGDEVDYHTAAGYRKMGELYDRDEGREEDVNQSLERAAEIMNRSFANRRNRERDGLLLVGILWDHGDIDVSADDFEKAVEHFQWALRVAETLAAELPASASWEARVAVSHYKLAEARLGLADFDQSLEHAKQALAIANRSEESFLEEETLIDLQDMQQLLGMIELKSGNPETAKTYFESNLAEVSELLRETPDAFDLYRHLFVALEGLAQIAHDANRTEEAKTFADRIDALDEELFQSVTRNDADYLMDIFILYTDIEWDWHLAGDFECELGYTRRRCRFLEKWIEVFPRDSLARIDLAISYQGLAETMSDEGELQESARLLDSAIATYETISPSDGNSSVNSIWLLEALVEAAEVQSQLQDTARVNDLIQRAEIQIELHGQSNHDELNQRIEKLDARLQKLAAE